MADAGGLFIGLMVIGLMVTVPGTGLAQDAETPVRDWGGAVYRGDIGGATALMSWSSGKRIEFLFRQPGKDGLHAYMLCTKPDVVALPTEVTEIECEYGRGLTLRPRGTDFEIVLNAVLAREVYYFLPKKTGPTTFLVRRVNPIATSYDPVLFRQGPKHIPNSSSESGRLGLLVAEPKITPADRGELERAVRRAGFDVMTLSLSEVSGLRSRVEEVSGRGVPSQKRVDDAVERRLLASARRPPKAR